MSDLENPNSEVAFLRSQVTGLQTRLCDVLTQQVAQQQTVLIASMQTNLALTQTVDRLTQTVDYLDKILDSLKIQEAEAFANERRPDGEFGNALAMLASRLLGGADRSASGKAVPFEIPKEIADLMQKRGGPQPVSDEKNPPPEGRAARASAKKPDPKEQKRER